MIRSSCVGAACAVFSIAAAQASTFAARPEAVRAHVEFLAHDLLEGRVAGSRGYDLAARYVASQFATLGLEPFGDRGDWYHRVPLLEGARVAPAASLAIERGGKTLELKPLVDFVPNVNFNLEKSSVEAPIAFVGFGVTAPELGYDDFANVDARGKIALVLTGAPARFSSHERAYYTSRLVKNANLVRHGVIGVIVFATPVDARRFPWERVVQMSWETGMRWTGPDKHPANAFPELRATVSVSHETAARLFEGSRRSLDEVFATSERGEPQGFDLPLRAKVTQRTEHRRLESSNVVGLLRGSDPRLAGEYVVLTAHLDGLGTGAPVNGDAIYNGAMDNATGVGVLIEAARALASQERPKRSILFMALTAEEKGLLGADYFATQPPVAGEKLVANINMDMPLVLTDLAELVAFGAEHSSLGAVAKSAAEDENFVLIPDPVPEETIFVRSDQYAFVRQGIPALFLTAGTRSRDRSVDGQALSEQFRRTHYHQPSDDARLPIHYPTLAALARVNARIALEVANARDAPRWHRGDFFGERFGKNRIASN